MSKNPEIKKCKKCDKELPSGYKYDCCEACRNQKAGVMKKVAKWGGGAAAVLGGLLVFIVTGGKRGK